jgi:cation-transporting ATPase 13A2
MSGFRGDDEVADGAVFDGPGSVNFPSSISTMRHEGTRALSRSFRESRRASMDADAGGGLRGSVSRRSSTQSLSVGDASPTQDGPEMTRERSFGRESLTGSVRNRSPDDTMQERQSIFGNIARLFGRRDSRSHSPVSRRSRSRQGSAAGDLIESPIEEEDEDDRWGYLSGEEDNDEDEGAPFRRPEYLSSRESFSRPPSPTDSLPGMLRDPIFGDTRVDIGEPTLLDDRPPPPGPPSRQGVYIADEDIELRFLGYELQEAHEWMWTIATILTAGLLGLLGQWFPKIWLNWVAKEKGFKLCSRGIIVVEACRVPFPECSDHSLFLFFRLPLAIFTFVKSKLCRIRIPTHLPLRTIHPALLPCHPLPTIHDHHLSRCRPLQMGHPIRMEVMPAFPLMIPYLEHSNISTIDTTAMR